MRNIKRVYRAGSQHWVGNGSLAQPLFSHTADGRCTNPSLMLGYTAPYEFTPSETHGSRDVGQRPHKGFETVTIVYHGEVARRDSSGGSDIIHEGDVQWMTVGPNIIHEEFHPENFGKRGELLEMVQLRISLLTRGKNTLPRYQHLAKANILVVKFPNRADYLRPIAGECDDIKGAADTFTGMDVWDVMLHADKEAELRILDDHNLSMVILRGTATFDGNGQTTAGELINFKQAGGKVHAKTGGEEAEILLLFGIPIDEPVVGYDLFVMDTAEEIRQVVSSFKSGKLGRTD